MCCPCLMIFTNKCLITFTNKFLLVVLFSCQVLTNFLQLHGLQHTRLPCPLPSPGVCSNTCPLSQWCYLRISSSATLFSFCLQSFPASGSFPMSWLFSSGGQSMTGSSSLYIIIPEKTSTSKLDPMDQKRWKCIYICFQKFTYKIFGSIIRLSSEKRMLLNCGAGEASWESLGLQGDKTSPS